MAYGVFFYVAKPISLRPPEVYSITLEGGKTLGGLSQVPANDKKAPVAPPKASGQEAAELQAKKLAKEAQDAKDAEVSLAEKEALLKLEREKADEEKKKAEADKKKDEERKKADEAKKKADEAKKARQALEDTEKQYQKSMQRYLGESSDAGGKGFGAAKVTGGNGMGGGVLRPPEFFIYRDLLKNHIKKGWNWYDQNATLSTVISFRVSPDGALSDINIDTGSGNRNYDESVLRAVEKASPAPVPPAKVYEFFKEVRMTFTPGE